MTAPMEVFYLSLHGVLFAVIIFYNIPVTVRGTILLCTIKKERNKISAGYNFETP
jgi:hypothetical protein